MRGRPRNKPRTPFERRLRKLMQKAEIPSYARLAQLSGVNPSTIQRLCSGDAQPSVPTLQALATTLNCKIDDLLQKE